MIQGGNHAKMSLKEAGITHSSFDSWIDLFLFLNLNEKTVLQVLKLVPGGPAFLHKEIKVQSSMQ
jgi:hypothetical protein